jgi:16S rRNA processing protein RimM
MTEIRPPVQVEVAPAEPKIDEASFISIGRIIKPVGLSGEMKVWPLTDFPERFQTLHQVRVATAEANLTHRISASRQVGNHLYLRFSGVTEVGQANLLRGGLIQIPEEARFPLSKGSYYQYEIVGLDVFTEAGEKLGQVGDILETGSNDVYVVRGGGEEYYIPALVSVVLKIDLEVGRMIIRPMPGLLEANARKPEKRRPVEK